MYIFEYIWLDGQQPTQELRSKIKIKESPKVDDWTFDGSSTYQADIRKSDLILKPARTYLNPFFENAFLVLCEVYEENGKPHQSNSRRKLAEICSKVEEEKPLVGIEQEYILIKDGWPLGWPKNGYPEPQGKYYCGIGSNRIFGRKIAEEHMQACIKAGIKIAGINAEVIPSQWEYQIGPSNPLKAADDLWISRYILLKIAEKYGVTVSFNPKPIGGKWNGSGAHINFSTENTRNSCFGNALKYIIEKLKKYHSYLLMYYGEENDKRLNGSMEASHFIEFKCGEMDRTASVRIPLNTLYGKAGYIEDRRPAANMNPYDALAALLEVVFELE